MLDTYEQCDQMTRLLVKYLAKCKNKILPNRIKILPKWVKIPNNPFENGQSLLKFCQSGHTDCSSSPRVSKTIELNGQIAKVNNVQCAESFHQFPIMIDF